VRGAAIAGLGLWAVAAVGCDTPPQELSDPPSFDEARAAAPTDEREGIRPMTGFSWVIEDRLAGMPRPGVRRPLALDLAFVREAGVDLLVSLTEEAPAADALAAAGLDALHIPVKDFTAPTLEQMHAFVAAVRQRHTDGQVVGVHCGAGLGRTGTMLAAYFVAEGMTAPKAIAHVRSLRPGSIETVAQEQAIAAFEHALRQRAESALP
jgi:atypical dual specificity phosphatase